jgi:hypothetical protein
MRSTAEAFVLIALVMLVLPPAARAADAEPSGPASGRAASPPKEIEDKFVGEYLGTFTSSAGAKADGVAKVYARQSRKGLSYRAALCAVESGLIEKTVIAPGAKVLFSTEVTGSAEGPRMVLKGGGWSGSIEEGKLTAEGTGGKLELRSVVRKSPTELAEPPPGAIVLLPYKAGRQTSLAEWTNKQWALLPDGSMMVSGGDNNTTRRFSKFKLHLEFRIPALGRGSGNSGVYILDRYEIQVLDSFGRKPSKGGCAAVYQTFPAAADACLPTGRWQTYDITFRGPKLEGDKAVKLPKVTVVHNGVTVHKDVDVPHATGNARSRGHAETGPIRIQSHGSPVRYRNIWIVELDK